MKNKKRKRADFQNTGSDRYLITYADLITLLLGLFVILYATSQVDAEKFKEYSQAFSEFFSTSKDGVLEGGDGILPAHKEGVPEAILPIPKERNLEEIKDMTLNSLAKFMQAGTVHIEQSDDGLKIILSESLLFKSAKSQLEQSGIEVLDSLATVLRDSKQIIMIDGHTDAEPIKNFVFESNWHLSTARATNVAYRLVQDGVPEYNMIVRGFGSQRPIGDNTSAEGQAMNRRVEIYLQDAPPEAPSEDGYESYNKNTLN